MIHRNRYLLAIALSCKHISKSRVRVGEMEKEPSLCSLICQTGSSLTLFISLICIVAHLITFLFFYLSLSGRDNVYIGWTIPVPVISNGTGGWMTIHETRVFENYPYYDLIWISFTWSLLVYLYVLGPSPTSLSRRMYETVMEKMKKKAAKRTSTGGEQSRATIVNHENGNFYSFVYLFMLRWLTYPVLAVLFTRLMGHDSIYVLFGMIQIFISLSFCFFLGDSMLDHTRQSINEGKVNQPGKKETKSECRFDTRNSPYLTFIPMIVVHMWLFAVLVLSYVFVQGIQTVGLPKEFEIVSWLWFASTFANSFHFLIAMGISVSYMSSPDTFMLDSDPIVWYQYIVHALMHLLDNAIVIVCVRLILQYCLGQSSDLYVL